MKAPGGEAPTEEQIEEVRDYFNMRPCYQRLRYVSSFFAQSDVDILRYALSKERAIEMVTGSQAFMATGFSNIGKIEKNNKANTSSDKADCLWIGLDHSPVWIFPGFLFAFLELPSFLVKAGDAEYILHRCRRKTLA